MKDQQKNRGRKPFKGHGHQNVQSAEQRYALFINGRQDGELQTFPQFKRVAIHKDPHADEILALMMLETPEGKKAFPNLDTSAVEYIDRNELPHHRTYRQRPACLHVGCGGDPLFDEHVHPNGTWEAACTLVGRATGLITHPFWAKLIEDVRREDRHGGASNGEIAWMLKMLYLSHSAGEVSVWARTAYDAEKKSMGKLWNEIKASEKNSHKRRVQFARRIHGMKPLTTKTAKVLLREQGHPNLEWFERLARETMQAETERCSAAEETFLQVARCYTVEREHDSLRLFVVTSDNQEMARVCWRKFKGDIVVIRGESGRTAILTKTDLRLNLAKLHAELVRIEPAEGADWVLAGEGGKLLNGSLKFTGVTPSGLTLPDLASVIQRTLGTNKGTFAMGMAFNAFEAQLAKLPA